MAWTLAAGSFTDANNEALSYSVLVERPAHEELYWNAQDGAGDTRPRPTAWVAASDVGLSINAGNGTLSGNVQPIVGGTETFYNYRVKLIATDPAATMAIAIGRYDYAMKLLQRGYSYDLRDLLKTSEIRVVSADMEPARQQTIALLKRRLAQLREDGPARPEDGH